MKILARIALIAVVLSTSLSAKPAGNQRLPRLIARQEVPAPVVAKPALWKVADADTTIYLFGSVHALPKNTEWLDGRLEQAFEQSQELVTEIVEPADGDTALAATIGRMAVMPPGRTLRSMLGPKARARYEAAMRAYKLPVDAFDRMEPWFAAISLTAMQVTKAGYDPDSGVEKALSTRAAALKRPHTALETIDYQMGLFDTLPVATQLRFLNEVTTDSAKAKAILDSMIDAWKRGDADRLARIMNEDQSEPELMDRLLTQRNRNWAGWIVQRLEKPGVVFVAVGAGHLAGAGSVQDQLAGKGVTTTRVQ
jgi:uncharacterized protein